MRTIPTHPNVLLRDAIEAARTRPGDPALHRDVIDGLLGSTVALTHDGSVRPRDGHLPKGRPLSFGVERDDQGGFLLAVYSDRPALLEPDAPTIGPHQPVVALAGDDLVILAARNGLGLELNPGSEAQLRVDSSEVADIAERVARVRSDAGIRVFDTHTIVTMRRLDPQLDDVTAGLIAAELRGRGLELAYVVEYAVHDEYDRPGPFHLLVVVGNGPADAASNEQLADARTVVSYVTGRPADAVAFASMPQAADVSTPLLDGDAAESSRAARFAVRG